MDITEHKHVEQALQASEERLTAIFDTANIGISITDADGKYVMFNDWWSGKLDYDNEEIQSLTNIDITHPEDKEASKRLFDKVVNGDIDRYRLEKRFVRKDGSFFWADASVSAIKDKNGAVTNVVAMVADITERKDAERQVQELVLELASEKDCALEKAKTDGLTGLANRRYFDDTLRTELLRLTRSNGILSLIMVDIDHFKKFNDSYGHVAGDDCLRKVASALQHTVWRAPDTVARYGGEEFAIILPDTESHGAALLAERIRKSVEELGIPYLVAGAAGYVTISLGFVTVPAASLAKPEEAVALADSALYAAKDNGRNRVEMAVFPAEFKADHLL
jgi:diguanylate cyclase (GGDEF)-like protein/PAS domain S-box-containing protein